jgi:hypothetical protein
MTNVSGTDEITLDFAGVSAISFQPVPSGDYHCRISRVEQKMSQKGNQMLNIWFDVVAPMAPIEIPEGKTVYKQINLAPASLPYAKPFFDAVTDTTQPISFSPSQLVGYDIGLVLGQGSYMKENEDGTKTERKTNTVEGFFKIS